MQESNSETFDQDDDSDLYGSMGESDSSVSINPHEPRRLYVPEQLMPMGGPRVVLLCAEEGMGRSSLLSHCVLAHLEKDIESRLIDFSASTTEESYAALRQTLRWCHRRPGVCGTGRVKTCVAFDNLPIGDEADVACAIALVRKLVKEGCLVAISCLPSGELIEEQMGEAMCFWSCDLVATRPVSRDGARVYDEYTHGIPLLVNALARIEQCSSDKVPTYPIYQEAYIKAIEATVRDDMMSDERRLRCAMLLLGYGTREDVSDVLGRLDPVLWRLVPRDSPFFGVEVTKGTFCCAGAHSSDCLNLSFATLNTIARPWPDLVAKCVQKLASRGNVGRAAVISLMCKDDLLRCQSIMQWGMQMIDVGEVDVVTDALETIRTCGFEHLDGMSETLVALDALAGNKERECEAPGDADGNLRARHAWLITKCRSMMRRGLFAADVVPSPLDDKLATALVVHAQAIRLLAEGRLAEAYDLLLNSAVRLDTPTVSSVLVELDYLLCSFLMGIVPAEADMSLIAAALPFLERTGLKQLSDLHDVTLSVAMLLGGRTLGEFSLEAALQRASRRGDDFFHAMLLLAAGIADMRSGVLPRAHVRFEQAVTFFADSEATGFLKTVRLLDLVARAQMGERIPRSEVNSCKGITPTMDGVVTMLGAALSSKRLTRYSASSGWGAASRVHEVHWIVNVLSNDCGAVSHRFSSVMPTAWLHEQKRSTLAIDDCLKGGAFSRVAQSLRPTEEGVRLPVPTRRLVEEARIEVHMMGGFEVYAEGRVIPSNRLDKRRSKALLALLAAVPGHVVKRYMIMETVWPNYDYQSANKCVYTATSVLRSEMGMALGGSSSTSLIISNKSQGTVALNTSAIGCDVDVFERKARELVDMVGTDRETVVLCREIEELYKGDMFVPPTDGMGVIETRSRTLRELFSDAMVAGARAALREGMKMLACRFARKAHDADELREDAVTILVAALSAAGRRVDAERCFEHYVGHVVDLTRKPPSRQLRASVEELLRESNLGVASARQKGNARQDAWIRMMGEGDAEAANQLELPFEESEEDEDEETDGGNIAHDG